MALQTPDSEVRIFRDSSPGLRLILIAMLSVALIALDKQGQYLPEIRRTLAAGLYPLEVAVSAPVAGARWLRRTLASRRTLLAENYRLRDDILLQDARLQRFAALEAENARLRALLKSTAKVGDDVVIAEILSVDMDPVRHRIVLNKGSRDGAYVGQALIDAQGIVGQITRDQVFTSEAVLITDPDHAVPVEFVRTGQRTIAMGTGEFDRLSLPFLTRNADVQPGDLLVTSGLGGTFPGGYPVASVAEVDSTRGDAFLEVSAEPAAALERIREVLLVFAGQPLPGSAAQPEAAAEPPAAGDAGGTP